MAQEVEAVRAPHAALWRSVLPAIVYLAVSLWATWPMARVASNHMVSHFTPEDILLDLWTLSWDAHALAHHPTRLFDANIFHPLNRTLALSEHLLGHLPIFAPVWAITGNAVLGLNLVVFTSFWLSGLFMHVLIQRWTGAAAAAYTAGLSFAFAPWHMATFHTPHQLCVQYFPLILLALDRAGTTGRLLNGLLAAGVITLQLLCSFYLAYMSMVLIGCYLIAELLVRGIRGRGRQWLALACAVILPPLLVLPVSLPYVGAISAPMERYVGNPVMVRMAAKLTPPSIVVGYYIGQGTAVLAALMPVVWIVSHWRADVSSRVRLGTLVLAIVAGFTISPGPAGMLDGWIAPYTWLSAIVPGFSLIRIPGRFAVLANFGASALAGFAVARIVDALRDRRQRAAVGMAAVAAASAIVWWQASYYPFRLKAFPLRTGADVPAVYQWLAANGNGGPLLELEVQRDSGDVAWCAWRGEAMAMYYSTFHWLPILNGYSGYQPPSYGVIQEEATKLPNIAALQTLADCAGLHWILVHRIKPAPESRWGLPEGLRDVATFPDTSGGEDRLYEVLLTPQSPCRLDLTTSSL